MERIRKIHSVEHWLYNHHMNFLAQMLRGGGKNYILCRHSASSADR